MSSTNQTFRYPPGPGLNAPQLVPSAHKAGVTYYDPELNGRVPRRPPTRMAQPPTAQQMMTSTPGHATGLQGFPTARTRPHQAGVPGQQRPSNKTTVETQPTADTVSRGHPPSAIRTQATRTDRIASDIAQASRSRAKSQPPRPAASSPTTPDQHTSADHMSFSHRPPMGQQPPSASLSGTPQLKPGHEQYQQKMPTRPRPDEFSSEPDSSRRRTFPSAPLGEPDTPLTRPTAATQRRSQSSAPHSRPYSAQGMRKETSAQVLLQQAWEMEEDRHAEEVATLRAEIATLQQQVEITEQISSSKEQETSHLQEEVAELAAQLQENQDAHDLSLANAKRAVDLIRQKSDETESSFQALLKVNDDRVKNEIVRLEQKLDEACMAIEAGVDQGKDQENRSGRLPAYHDIVARYTTAVHNSKRATETAKTAADESRACEMSLKDVENRCIALEKAKDKAGNLVDGLKKERDAAEANLSQAKIEWTEEKKDLREDMKQLRIELTSRNNDIAILMAEKAEVIGQLSAIKVERDTAVAKYDIAKEEVADAEGRRQSACDYLEKAGLLDSEGEYDELAQQAMDEEHERHQAEIEGYETRMNSLNEEIKRLTAELSRAEKITSSSQEKSQVENTALQQARSSIAQLESKLAAKEEELTESMVAGRTSAQQLQSLREEIQNAKSRERRAKTDLDKEMTLSNKGQMQIVALNEKVVNLEKQVVAQTKPHASIAFTAAQTELVSSRQNLEKALKEIAQYESQIAQADETALERKEEIERLAAARVELLQELDDNNKSLAKSQRTVEEQAGRLKNLLERPGQAPTAQLQQELAILKEDHEKLRKSTGQKEADVAKRWNEGNLTAEEKKAVQLAVQVANESWTVKMKKKDEDVKKYKQDAARLKAEADAMYKVFHNLPSSDSSLSDLSEGRTMSPEKVPTAGPSKSSMASSKSGDTKKKARFANAPKSRHPQDKSKSSTSKALKRAEAPPLASLPESIGQFSSEADLQDSLPSGTSAPAASQQPGKAATRTQQRKRKTAILSDDENDETIQTKRATRASSRTPSLMASQMSLNMPIVTQNPDKLRRNHISSGPKDAITVPEETEDGGD